MDTSHNPRRHVIFIEIQPNAYIKYLSQTAEPVVIVTIWRINRQVVHGQSAVRGEAAPCSMYSLVKDNVHANPVVKCVLHAVYILSERDHGPLFLHAPTSQGTCD